MRRKREIVEVLMLGVLAALLIMPGICFAEDFQTPEIFSDTENNKSAT